MRTTAKNLPVTLHAYFDGKKCRACELLPRCVVRKPNNGKKGNYHLEVGAHLVARDVNLAQQAEDGWWDVYSIRAGIEATVSELKRGHGLGKLRVRRMPRVRLAVGLKMTACNIKRWLRAAVADRKAAADKKEAPETLVYSLYALMYGIWTALARKRSKRPNSRWSPEQANMA